MDNNDIAVELKNVNKIYKLYSNGKKQFLGIFFKFIPYTNKRASDNLSFIVKKGETVAFLGANGSGKSTLLKMITGVSYPTSGELIVNGKINALLELTAGFNQECTGRENIYIKCSILNMSNEEIKNIEKDIIEFADIGEYLDQPVKTYSSGMKARLGFAISVNIVPDILIVDEVLSVGDRDFKNKCLTKVKELIFSDKITVLFVTHSMQMAKEFCDRGIVLKKGKLVFDGTIDDAEEYYNTKY